MKAVEKWLCWHAVCLGISFTCQQLWESCFCLGDMPADLRKIKLNLFHCPLQARVRYIQWMNCWPPQCTNSSLYQSTRGNSLINIHILPQSMRAVTVDTRRRQVWCEGVEKRHWKCVKLWNTSLCELVWQSGAPFPHLTTGVVQKSVLVLYSVISHEHLNWPKKTKDGFKYAPSVSLPNKSM